MPRNANIIAHTDIFKSLTERAKSVAAPLAAADLLNLIRVAPRIMMPSGGCVQLCCTAVTRDDKRGCHAVIESGIAYAQRR